MTTKTLSRLILTIAVLCIGLPASATPIEDARYAQAQLRGEFFSENRGEIAYALDALAEACYSVLIPSNDVTPKVPAPCDSFFDTLRAGCADPDDEHPQFVCAGRLIEAETVYDRGWSVDLRPVLREIASRVRAAAALEADASGRDERGKR